MVGVELEGHFTVHYALLKAAHVVLHCRSLIPALQLRQSSNPRRATQPFKDRLFLQWAQDFIVPSQKRHHPTTSASINV
jgi:hypothetical protein